MNEKAYTSNNQIHLSSNYIESYSGNVKTEVTGILYHHMTHVWQWNAKGQAPEWLMEGIADFVRLKAGYASSQWAKPGEGDKWDQSSDVTAMFLDYCDSLRSGFVAELNKKLKGEYSDGYFNDLLGKSVSLLWDDYKGKYKN
ncbi:Basic secretory protease [Bienertia sinuspersici]